MEEEIFRVYKIINKVNNKIYVGITKKGLEDRLKEHKSKARCGSQYPLHVAIREYGEENFIISLIEVTVDRDKLPLLEKKYISLFQSDNPDYGYNDTCGGEYQTITEAMRLAMGKGQQGCVKPRLRKGVIQYSATGDFIKEFSGMTEASKETGVSRAAMLRMLKGEIKKGSKSNPYLWVWSSNYEEIPTHIEPSTVYTDMNYKTKPSEKCIAERKKYETKDGDLSKLKKPIIKYNTAFEKIAEYESVAEAARQNGITPEAIRCHLRGNYDYSDEKVLKRLKFIWKLK